MFAHFVFCKNKQHKWEKHINVISPHFTQKSVKKNKWGSLCWIHQSLFCLQEAPGNLVGNLWTHLCPMRSKVSNDYGNLCQLCFQMIKMILLYLHTCILFPGVLWEHRGYITAPFSHGLGKIVLGSLHWSRPSVPGVLIGSHAACWAH